MTDTATQMSGIDLPRTAQRGTIQHPWRLLKAAAAEDGAAAISLTDGESLTEVAASLLIDLHDIFGNSFDLVALAMFSAPDATPANPAADDTFGFDLVGYRSRFSKESDSVIFNPAQLICSANATGGIVGTQTVNGITNGLWVDSIALSFDDWGGDVQAYDSGNNRIATIIFDPMGLQFLRFYKHGALGSNAGEAPTVGLIGTVISS